jgi:hypothetical protein
MAALLSLLALPACSSDDDDDATPSSPPAATGLLTLEAPFDGQVVVTDTLDVLIALAPEADPASLHVTIDGSSIDDALSVLPDLLQARGEALSIDTGDHRLEAEVESAAGLERLTARFTARPGQALGTVIREPQQRIDGPSSIGRLGDYLLQNNRVQFAVQDLGRPFLGVAPFGGNVVDGDLVRRPWELERDQIGALSVGLNIEDTINPTEISLVSDGSDGGAAVLETRGPDDLLATFNVSSIATLFTSLYATEVPASADDVDLPVELVNRYILEPGKDYLTWETEVRNTSAASIAFYYGDYVNMTGDVEFFSPGAGWGTVDIRGNCDWIAYIDHGAPGAGAVGYIPEIAEGSTLVSLQGIQYPFLGQSALQALLGVGEPVFQVKAGDTLTLRRWLVLGRDAGAVADARIDLLELAHGTVGGTVTRGGAPIAGARVAALRTPRGGSGAEVVDHWITGEDGRWQGWLEPGAYTIEAAIDGTANPDGAQLPPAKTVTVSADAAQTVDFAFPAPAGLRVRITDEHGAPVPAKLSVVGFDPSPDPAGIDPALSRSVHAVFGDPDRDPLPFGLTRVAFAGTDGDTGRLELEPGDYAIFVSRGQEYSIFQQKVTLAAGEDATIDARIARVIDTPGFAAGDFHVHSIDSFDAPVPRDLRAKTLLAEGLDMFAATDHTLRIDYTDTVARLGGSDLLAPFIGEEVTTFDIGHYNVYPVTPDSSRANLGGVDWAGDAPAGGGFPSSSHYDLSPGQLMDRLQAEAGDHVVQLNHINNVLHGSFSLVGVDTAQIPPRSRILFRQDPSITNLFTAGWTALEIWRGYTDDEDLVFRENLGDYFNLLNQGIVRTMMADSDTHASIDVPTGGPRSYVGLGDATGTTLAQSGDALAAAIHDGRVVCSNGPFLQVELETPEGTAGLSPGLPTRVRATAGKALLRITISSPAWAAFDEIGIYRNNAPFPMADDDDAPGQADYQGVDLSGIDVPRYEVAPDILLSAGVDFEIDAVEVFPEIPGATRLEASIEVPLEGLTEDTWVVVMVRGTDGVSGPLFPMIPANLEPENNLTLDDLLDGNVGEGGVLALALSNPLFLDVDGDGEYDPPGVRLRDAPAGGSSEGLGRGRYGG